MKKFLIIILLIVVIGGLYIWKSNSGNGRLDTNTATYNSSSGPDASSATFTIENEKVSLVDGKAEEKDEAGGTVETQLLDVKAVGDINGDSKDDAVVTLAQSGGGSGTFIYVAAYVSGPVNYKGTNAIFIGDRISPQSFSISNGIVTFTYLDRSPEESFAAEPTIQTTKQFVLKTGELIEK